MEARQAIGLHLGPVEGNIGEIFDIHLEASKRRISGLDGAKIVFAFVPASGFACQFVLAEDAVQSVVADFEIKLGDETAGAEAGGLFAFGDAFGFQFGRGFMRAGMRGAADGNKALVVNQGKAADPFADGVSGTLVAGCGWP